MVRPKVVLAWLTALAAQGALAVWLEYLGIEATLPLAIGMTVAAAGLATCTVFTWVSPSRFRMTVGRIGAQNFVVIVLVTLVNILAASALGVVLYETDFVHRAGPLAWYFVGILGAIYILAFVAWGFSLRDMFRSR